MATVCVRAGLDLVHACSGPDGRLNVLVGNTRSLWPVAAGRLDADAEHPLDDYVTRVIGPVAAATGGRVTYAHERPYPPIQQIAHRAGLAYLGAANLSVHPRYGPWIALRAVIGYRCKGRETRPPRNPCRNCRCGEALARALDHPFDWRAWLAVRDACPIGREHRYHDAQLIYHYTRDRSVLRAALATDVSDPSGGKPPDPGVLG